MNRRGIFKTMLAAAVGTMAARGARAEADSATPRVVYHLADLDKVDFVLGNIRNHFDGMGGPDKVRIALVVHGPALKAFHSADAHTDVVANLSGVAKQGVQLNACINTMRAQKVTLTDLLPGFIVAEKGGVARLAELQGQGYAYLRP
jgi:uncharacterized protein